MDAVTCTAPVNIAVIKYWGKRDEALILPINSSLSATLSQEQLCAKTTVAVSGQFTRDRMWLNGKEESLENPRYQNVLREIRRRARKRKIAGEGKGTSLSDALSWHVHICSVNNFPTAAGLASSAAGFSCLVYSLAKLFRIEGDISEIARQGSGSACRSLYGGFVSWNMGEKDDGTDSVAEQLVTENHWPELQILILVVSDQKKHIGSSAGMGVSVKTSELLRYRAEHIVPRRMKEIETAIQNKDFQTFAKITMQDSNQLHASCLDTYPPIIYLNDTSKQIMHLVHKYNDFCGEIKVAYTFDAGPNACLYLLEEDVAGVLAMVNHCFPPIEQNGDQYIRGLQVEELPIQKDLKESLGFTPLSPGALKYIIHTKVGAGPQVLPSTECLLDENGLPKDAHS
ncbi:diphosphomevalonate decarboxylase-like [Lingula anatina]|uniref:Diphosphomevalonate decarboxylase n=1 Tax=Lingula anatina TaxID=7574 RepID=A0A1S3JKE6_LINAN|nr:diphosphomevalonate decarboxylase-like [Lingula anatina]|eukprot:XP_013410848.1 diphosphomevalonate decarboxylase-like [Lingula anatina]